MSFISYLINGISLGSVYAIIALGYTMVYGIAKMLNFAHGDVIMVGAYIVLTCGLQAPVEQLQELYNLLGERAKNSEYGRIIAAQLSDLGRVAVDKVAPDFTVNSPEGKPISLHGIKAKAKLVVCWASWCGPCRAEIPNVIRLYKRYRDKGLEVLGVSLDDDKSKWVQAIMEDGLPWLNGSDLKGQASEVARVYGVRSIPFTLLLY